MFKTALLGVAVGSVGITKGLGGGVKVFWCYYKLTTGFLLLVQASYRITVELLWVHYRLTRACYVFTAGLLLAMNLL